MSNLVVMVRRHYQAIPIVVGHLAVKLDDLHEARPFVNLTELPLELVKDAGSVRKIVSLVDSQLMRARLWLFQRRDIVIGIDSHTLPSV